MQFLYWRHPEIRMPLELPIKPRRSGFVCSYAQKIGICVPSKAVMLFSIVVISVVVIAVTAVTIALVTVPMVTVAGFEWPIPTHRPIFSIRNLKSKPGMSGCALHGRRENR